MEAEWTLSWSESITTLICHNTRRLTVRLLSTRVQFSGSSMRLLPLLKRSTPSGIRSLRRRQQLYQRENQKLEVRWQAPKSSSSSSSLKSRNTRTRDTLTRTSLQIGWRPSSNIRKTSGSQGRWHCIQSKIRSFSRTIARSSSASKICWRPNRLSNSRFHSHKMTSWWRSTTRWWNFSNMRRLRMQGWTCPRASSSWRPSSIRIARYLLTTLITLNKRNFP